MKLILSSCDFSNPESAECIIRNLPKPIEECKVLFIPNEKATPELINSPLYRERLNAYGFSFQNIIVFDHTRSEDFKSLSPDVIYVSGGNTFGTLTKLRKCRFDEALIDYIKSGVTYIGGSAGAHIVTQNIKHIEEYDENNVGLTDYSGLGLFDGILVCHYTYHRKAHLDRLISEGVYAVHFLTDYDSIVIEA